MEDFKNALVLAILQAFEKHRKKGAILLIEEPEMFLHPQMQRSLYQTLRKIGETNQSKNLYDALAALRCGATIR